MSNQKNIRLSSSSSGFLIHLALLAVIMMIPAFGLIIMTDGFHIGIIIGIVIYLFVLLIIVSQFNTNCDARIIDNKLVLKKMYKSAKSYSFDRIAKVESSRLRRVQYIYLDMTNDDGELEYYMIASHDSSMDPGAILNDLRSEKDIVS
jgi:hypothetical protein